MFAIQSDIALPALKISSSHAIPKDKKPKVKKLNPAQLKVVERYKYAYTACHGVPPILSFDGEWYTIVGCDARVSHNRLKDMTRQLEFRTGKRLGYDDPE